MGGLLGRQREEKFVMEEEQMCTWKQAMRWLRSKGVMNESEREKDLSCDTSGMYYLIT